MSILKILGTWNNFQSIIFHIHICINTSLKLVELIWCRWTNICNWERCLCLRAYTINGIKPACQLLHKLWKWWFVAWNGLSGSICLCPWIEYAAICSYWWGVSGISQHQHNLISQSTGHETRRNKGRMNSRHYKNEFSQHFSTNFHLIGIF